MNRSKSVAVNGYSYATWEHTTMLILQKRGIVHMQPVLKLMQLATMRNQYTSFLQCHTIDVYLVRKITVVLLQMYK